jgi:hypothetical protein
MSKIVLPKTIPQLLMRQFHIWEVEYGKYNQEQLHKIMIEDHYVDYLKFKDFQFELHVFFQEDEGNCYLRVWFCVGNKLIFSVKLTEKETFEKFLSDEFKFEYEFCPCGEKVFENGMCKNCFLYDYEHEEDCCVCLQNGRRWVELECGHLLHFNCRREIKNKKCPLCRTKTEIKNSRFGFGDSGY